MFLQIAPMRSFYYIAKLNYLPASVAPERFHPCLNNLHIDMLMLINMDSCCVLVLERNGPTLQLHGIYRNVLSQARASMLKAKADAASFVGRRRRRDGHR